MSTGGVAVPPGSGREVSVGRNTLTVKSGPEEGHTLVGMFESAIPPGGGFPFAHVHDEYEEVFYVLEGEVEYRLGESWAVALGHTGEFRRFARFVSVESWYDAARGGC